MSFLLSTCPREPFEEQNVSINYFSPTFFGEGNFSDFWGSFFGKAARSAIYVTGDVFSWNVFFERTGCFYKYFQKLSGRLLNFCPVFWQRCLNCIPCVQRNIPRKKFLSKKSQLYFRILIHKNLILRNNSACS